MAKKEEHVAFRLVLEPAVWGGAGFLLRGLLRGGTLNGLAGVLLLTYGIGRVISAHEADVD